MKKLILLVGSLSLLFIGCFLTITIYPQNSPTFQTIKSRILMNRLTNEHFDLKLFYSDLTSSHIQAYDVQNSTITPSKTAYSSFTEGFIESDKNALLLKAVNQYRAFHDLDPINYYYNYTEIDHYGFLSLTEGLDTLYIINLSNEEVVCPSFDSTYAFEDQYIYHIVLGKEGYYILTAQSNGYMAFLYTLSPDDFHVLSARRLSPPSKALLSHHYAIDSAGNAYFIGHYSLLMISSEEAINIPLNFDPDSIYCFEDTIYAFSTSELFLSYAVFKDDIGMLQTGQVNLPNKFVKLVGCYIKDSILYTVFYDNNHPLYRNYITLYNLKNNTIIYCLALKSAPSNMLALLDTHFQA